MGEALLGGDGEAVGRVAADRGARDEGRPLHVVREQLLGGGGARDRGALDGDGLRVVAAEVGGVDDDAADHAGGAEADQRPVVVLLGGPGLLGRDTAAPAGLPAVHDLALVPEVLGVELGGPGHQQVLALGEELVVGGDDTRAELPVGKVGVLGEGEVGGAVVRVRVAASVGLGVAGEAGQRGVLLGRHGDQVFLSGLFGGYWVQGVSGHVRPGRGAVPSGR
ncbi:hypothetical protein RKD44_001588 [Streptomyces collinus]